APALSVALEELDRANRLVRLGLLPLSRLAAGELIRALGGARRDESSLAPLEERVWRWSEGNPFMIVEMMQAFREVPSMIEAAEGLQLPERARAMIARGFARLSEGPRNLIALAAMIGRRSE